MKDIILSNVRKENKKIAIILCVLGIIFLIGTIYGLIGLISDGLEALSTVFVFGILVGITLKGFYKHLMITIDPLKSDSFKEYGGVDNLVKIIEEVENTAEYQDDQIIIAKNYVADRKNVGKLLSYKDILRVRKLDHKKNLSVNGYAVVITDKNEFDMAYEYPIEEEEKVDNLISLIESKCDNINTKKIE